MGPFGKPRPPGWVQIEPIANGEGTDLAQICARSRFAARADAGPCARVGSARDREPDSPLRAYWSVYELTHRTPGSRRAAGSRSTRTEICWHTIFACGEPQWYGKTLIVRRAFVELLLPILNHLRSYTVSRPPFLPGRFRLVAAILPPP